MFRSTILNKLLRTAIVTYIFIMTVVVIIIYHMSKEIKSTGGISCILLNTDDALPSFENSGINPANDSIFFHETSCLGELKSRQACGVEAAARMHPNYEIYVLFCALVTDYVLKRSSLAILGQFENIKFGRVHLEEYSKGTGFEVLVDNGLLKSTYPVEHTADLLRFMTLYKYGGIYLDLDVIVARPLDNLPENWLAMESDELIATGIIRFSKNGIGKSFSKAIIKEINNTFIPYLWAYNGPEAVTRVFKRMCTNNTFAWSNTTCLGLHIFDHDKFYPNHYSNTDYYLNPGDLEDSDTYTHHMWNQITRNKVIREDSRYAKLAKKFCPTIYKLYGKNFGNDMMTEIEYYDE